MATPQLRLSTRFLRFFKVFLYMSVAGVVVGILGLLLYNKRWDFLLAAVSWVVTVVILLRRLERLRDVVWEGDHLLVKDEADILVPLNEIENVELKTLVRTHEVTLHEEHPYLGESFLFQASLGYLFRHRQTDDTIHELRQRIVQARRASARSGRE